MAATLENPSTVPRENEQAWDEVGAEYSAFLQNTGVFKLSTCHEVAVSQNRISSVVQEVLGGQQWYEMISVCSSLLCVAFCSTFC